MMKKTTYKCDSCIYACEQIFFGLSTTNYCLKEKEYKKVFKCENYRVRKECQNCIYSIDETEEYGMICLKTKQLCDPCGKCKDFEEYGNFQITLDTNKNS